jgi:hypothetical protein
MTDAILVSNAQNTETDKIEIFFISPSGAGNNGTKIKAYTASNDTTTSHSYKAYIYNSSGAAVLAVIPQSIVVRDKADYGPSIIGHVIPKGGSLRMESSSADGSFLNFYVTGSQL